MKYEVIDFEVVEKDENIVDVIDDVKTEKQSTSTKPKTSKKTIKQSVEQSVEQQVTSPDVLLTVMFRKTCGIDGIRYSTHSNATILKSKLDKISPDCYIVIDTTK